MKISARLAMLLIFVWLTVAGATVTAQTLEKMRLGYSGTGLNISKTEVAPRTG